MVCEQAASLFSLLYLVNSDEIKVDERGVLTRVTRINSHVIMRQAAWTYKEHDWRWCIV
jgi:hypothetical protein